MAWVSPSNLTPDSSTVLNGVTVNSYLLKKHNVNNIDLPVKRTNKLKGVVIHNTDRAKSADDGRQYTAATLNNNVATRTHYYVTELGAWQNLEDTDMNWSCGDGTTGEGNNGCISLEIIMSSRNKAEDLKARDNGAKLAAYLLWKNHLSIDNLYTHNYFLNVRNGVKGDYYKLCTTATPTRNCPYYIVWEWEAFRKQVKSYMIDFNTSQQTEKAKTQTNTTTAPATTKTTSNQTVKTESSKASKIGVYLSISSAAMRESTSKLSKIVKRVQKGYYYLGEIVEDKWIKHKGLNLYSMLTDGGALFKKAGEAVAKVTTTDLNIRVKASIKSGIMITVPKGTVLYVFDETPTEEGGHKWRRAIINNKVGYVASEYLKDE